MVTENGAVSSTVTLTGTETSTISETGLASATSSASVTESVSQTFQETPQRVTVSASTSITPSITTSDTPSTVTVQATVRLSQTSFPSGYPARGFEPVEYIQESTFTSPVSDGSYNWVGLVTGYESLTETETQRFHLTNSTDKVASRKENKKIREGISVNIDYIPQDFTFLQYFTGANGSISDTMSTIQIGEKQTDFQYGTDERRRLLGCIGEEWVLVMGEDSAASVSATLIASDKEDWSDTDYIGAGSHATEDGSAPLTYDNLSNIELGGNPIGQFISELTLEITNKFNVYTSPTSSLDTEIDSVMLSDRSIKVSMTITYVNTNFANIVENFNKDDLTFDIGTTSFTINDVQFPEFLYVNNPGELKGNTVTSNPASDMSYG